MRARWRILVVVPAEPARAARLAHAEPSGLPPRDAALLAARLLALGAEVRVVDQRAERLSHRTVRREARLWRADLAILHVGGSEVADDPVPDARPLQSLLGAWPQDVPVLARGPLAWRYGAELLDRLPRLAGIHEGPVDETLIGRFEPAEVTGLGQRERVRSAPRRARRGPSVSRDPAARVLPAWHLLPLEAYEGRGPTRIRCASIDLAGGDLADVEAEVRHAVHRAGARFLVFEARDLAADRELAVDVARRMFGFAPGVPWACRVRANHVDPAFALALAQGACHEVLVTAPSDRRAPAVTPMDDPDRARLEGAVEAVRVTGMSALVEHVVGRPGHDRGILAAWQRWFRVRRMVVRPRVLVLHAGDRGPGQPALDVAREQAGCWDNALTPGDVERAVRSLGGGRPLALETAS